MVPNTLLHTKVRKNLYTYTHYVTAPILHGTKYTTPHQGAQEPVYLHSLCYCSYFPFKSFLKRLLLIFFGNYQVKMIVIQTHISNSFLGQYRVYP